MQGGLSLKPSRASGWSITGVPLPHPFPQPRGKGGDAMDPGLRYISYPLCSCFPTLPTDACFSRFPDHKTSILAFFKKSLIPRKAISLGKHF